ncbi:hypothetical protein [Actinomadura rupiterrae]|uniref:hypothetical protein n=1 Tax=Actinomadura rupiterrae TaxID=559627 RepID=UPI0020A5478B|nr:hypothetical protein [Actinomadura rupiterrae]MCP2340158.1 hypothetical protein [Actinomadura rupiterrae]
MESETGAAEVSDERLDGYEEAQQRLIDGARDRLRGLEDEADDLAGRLSRSFASQARAARLLLMCAEHRNIVPGTAMASALSSTAEIMPGFLRSPERRAEFTEVFARFLMLAAGIAPDAEVVLADVPSDLSEQAAALVDEALERTKTSLEQFDPELTCRTDQTRNLIAHLETDGPERRIAALCLSAEPDLAPLADALRSASIP